MSSVQLIPFVEKLEFAPSFQAELLERIRLWANELGFSQIGVASVDLSHAEKGLLDWLQKGFHGEMSYMSAHGLKRARPAELVPGTLSVLTAKMDYLPRDTQTQEGQWLQVERSRLKRKTEGVISVYARGRDYHKVMRRRLEQLAKRIQTEIGTLGYRVFTDSAPVLEVELATQSGLGWRGKHTLLLSRDSGSMFFLGEIYLNLQLEPTPKQDPHCGKCSACIDICPTGAITEPYVLDARKCISYLTIEHSGSIPVELRGKMGNHIYGCDDCQTACPWNKYARPSVVEDFDARGALVPVSNPPFDLAGGVGQGGKLIDYFSWTEQEFEEKTRGTAIHRIGHERWLRNVAVAMGNALSKAMSNSMSNSMNNSMDTALTNHQHKNSREADPLDMQEPPPSERLLIAKALSARLNHPSALVVEHVRWALSKLDEGVDQDLEV